MKMCSVGKFIRISMDRQTIKLPLVMKNYNFHLFITTGLIFVQFPIGGFQLVANHLFAKQFCSLLRNLHCPKFPNSAFHKDWYPQNSQKWYSYWLISKFKRFLCNCRFGFVPKILIECYSLVEEDCFGKSFFLIRASSHPDPDCPKNPRSSFNFGWSRFWYS